MQKLKFMDWESVEALPEGEVVNTVRLMGNYINARPGPAILESTFPEGGNADKGEPGEIRQFRAHVDGVLHVPQFIDLPDHVIETNHAGPEDHDELAEAMIAAYGDDAFDAETPVTVLWFRKVD